ncbi:MAG: fibronectin type III domain-containing protein [Chitinophagales bacterium]|nr:fibronectin type III domain-containing protein [Chitinophagales bacterium]
MNISNSTCANGYILEWIPNGGTAQTITTNIPAGNTSFSWTPTGSFTPGAGKIKIYDPNRTCINSNSQSYSVTLNASCGIPTVNAASNLTCNSFRANWASVSGATSYNVNIKTCSGSYVVGNAVSAGSSTFYNFTGLNPCECYQYQVQAVCGGTSGTWSSSSSQVSLTPPIF